MFVVVSSRLTALMHKIAHASRKSIEEQCDEIYGPGMKSHWTYRKELNPADKTARFPAEKLLEFCLVNQSVEAIVFIADGLDYRMVKRNAKEPVPVEPIALFSASTRLMELTQKPGVTRTEMVAATDNVIEEAEAIVYQIGRAHV